MKSDYLFPFWSLLSLSASQNIPQILSSHSQLSSLSSYVASFPRLAQQFKAADNFTFLAPTNDGISTWLAGNHSRDYIEATLTYHLLNGSYPSAYLSAVPLFIPSALTNTSYCNVTGGQRVKAFNDGNAVFGSALDTNSTVLTADIIATGGVVHIIDNVLSMPLTAIKTVTAANLSYYIAIGNEGGFLNTESRPFIDNFTLTPDLTWIVANSPQALAHLNVTGDNQTMLQEYVKYQSISKVVYSTDFENGTELITAAGLPLLITVQNGDIWVNTAKMTSRDLFGANGVMHVVDDLLNPSNITRPSFPSNQSNSSTPIPSATNQPTSGAPSFSAHPDSGLSTGAKTGIGVGVVGGIIAAITVAAVLICWRKRRSRVSEREEGQTWNNEHKPRELSSNPLDEMPQLETTESAVELPAGYVPCVEIGRAF